MPSNDGWKWNEEVLDKNQVGGASLLSYQWIGWFAPWSWGVSLSCPQCWWSRKSEVLIIRCRSSWGFLPRQLPQCEQRRRWCHYDDFDRFCFSLWRLICWDHIGANAVLGFVWFFQDGLELGLSMSCVESFPGRHAAWVGVSFLGGCLLNRTCQGCGCSASATFRCFASNSADDTLHYTCRFSAAIRGFKLSLVAHRDRTGADVSSVVKVRDGRRGQAYRHSWDSVTCHDFGYFLATEHASKCYLFKVNFVVKSHEKYVDFSWFLLLVCTSERFTSSVSTD